MKRFTLILLAVIAVTAFVGCTGNSVEARIENELKEYVKANFDDPREFEEIVSITATDTFTVENLNRMVKDALSLDSMLTMNEGIILKELDVSKVNNFDQLDEVKQRSVASKKDRFSNAIAEYVEIITDKEAGMHRDKLNSYLSDTTFTFNVTEYEIKFRTKKDDNLVMQTYYAQVNNNNGSIKISYKVAQKDMFGEKVLDIYELLDVSMRCFKKKGNILIELRDSYRDFKEALSLFS